VWPLDAPCLSDSVPGIRSSGVSLRGDVLTAWDLEVTPHRNAGARDQFSEARRVRRCVPLGHLRYLPFTSHLSRRYDNRFGNAEWISIPFQRLTCAGPQTQHAAPNEYSSGAAEARTTMTEQLLLWLVNWALRLLGTSILLPFRRFGHREENEAASVIVGSAVVGAIVACIALNWSWWWLRLAVGAAGGSLAACLLLAHHDV
jgi:hypothetical protein